MSRTVMGWQCGHLFAARFAGIPSRLIRTTVWNRQGKMKEVDYVEMLNYESSELSRVRCCEITNPSNVLEIFSKDQSSKPYTSDSNQSFSSTLSGFDL